MRSTLDHERERRLRRGQTDAEQAALWWQLRNRRLQGWKFRRQHRIGPYFADFACLEAGLVVELDGSQHLERQPYDRTRTAHLKREGFDVLRFGNDDVLRETEAVLRAIITALAPHPASGHLLPARGEKEKREAVIALSSLQSGEKESAKS